ncbi:MAG: hypothetical protein KBS81_06800, partial [Spirochaetales bacterium]|nr:hypothetical protein [Candidatus Physcosoma equi]
VEDLHEHSDYLTFGLHFLPDSTGEVFTPFAPSINYKGNLALWGKRFIKALESGLFLFAAHPDVFMNSYASFDAEAQAISRDIISAAIDLQIPLEINCNGIGKAEDELGLPRWNYPSQEFWRLASEMGASAVINSDAHRTENLTKHYQDAFDFAHRLGVKLVEPVLEDGRIRIPVHS